MFYSSCIILPFTEFFPPFNHLLFIFTASRTVLNVFGTNDCLNYNYNSFDKKKLLRVLISIDWEYWDPNNPHICWLASSLCLLSTSKLVCGGRSGALWLPSHHPGACCTLVGVEEIAPDNVERFECLESGKALYKCNSSLLLLYI